MSKVIGAETTAKLETQLNGKLIAYWSVTLLLAGSITLSGIGQLMQLGGNIELVKYWLPIIHHEYSWDLENTWSHRYRRTTLSQT